MRDERLLLDDIIAALDRIDTYTKNHTFESFSADGKTTDAVTYNLLVIGEAVRQLPAPLTDSYPEIPWRQVAGIRNLLAHACFSVDYNLLWKTVTVVLPQFRLVIERIQKD